MDSIYCMYTLKDKEDILIHALNHRQIFIKKSLPGTNVTAPTKQKLMANSDMSVEIMDPSGFKTLIGDVIGTFRDTTPAVKQKFIQKNRIRTSS